MRDQIIAAIRERFQKDPAVYAMWLEGADGLGKVDQYSDIDLWLDVEDGQERRVLEGCREALEGLAPLDLHARLDVLIDRDHPHPQIFQRMMHLSGTPEHLVLDLCVQSHSRGSQGATFVEGDVAEYPLVIFDRAGLITILPEPAPDREELEKGYREVAEYFGQRSRMTKYLSRGRYLESLTYYGKYVLEPLVLLCRLVHTPRHLEYGLTHISRHLPGDLVEKLEDLHQIRSLGDMAERLERADLLFQELEGELKKLYPFLAEIMDT